jgi:hypothetical protein
VLQAGLLRPWRADTRGIDKYSNLNEESVAMMRAITVTCSCVLAMFLTTAGFAQERQAAASDANLTIPKGARVYIAPIEGGYDIYLAAAMHKKQVPITIVVDKTKADFELSGVTETEKAGWAKTVFMGNTSTSEQASIKVVNLKSATVVFGYNVNKGSSARGKQSSSEACAKHLKEKIENGL